MRKNTDPIEIRLPPDKPEDWVRGYVDGYTAGYKAGVEWARDAAIALIKERPKQ
jgi:hypothetical protein